MKANEAPEKLYYAPYGDIREDNPITDNDIEYVRKDAFIEKAWNWIEDNMLSSNQQDKSRFYYEQFINYMKGEEV